MYRFLRSITSPKQRLALFWWHIMRLARILLHGRYNSQLLHPQLKNFPTSACCARLLHQHLGAMVNELDDAARVGGRGAPVLPGGGVRGVLVKAAGDKTKPYAGTALYSLAEDSCATRAQKAATKRGPPVFADSFRQRAARRSAPTCRRGAGPEGWLGRGWPLGPLGRLRPLRRSRS